jgi:hypothetical protein
MVQVRQNDAMASQHAGLSDYSSRLDTSAVSTGRACRQTVATLA